MQVFEQPSQMVRQHPSVCAAIGVFDGIHLGHQEVIRQTVERAKAIDADSVVITFNQHPATVVAPDRAPTLICNLAKKLELLEHHGVTATLVIEFDAQFSQTPADEFVLWLSKGFQHFSSLAVGPDFIFGKGRQGNLQLLKRMGSELKFELQEITQVLWSEKTVSSTRIRQAVKAGELELAAAMLGRQHCVSGPVLEGRKFGRTIGVPTANIATHGLLLPPNGVYTALVRVDDTLHPAVLNLGFRPTLEGAEAKRLIEAHLLDFKGNLYGKTLELSFEKKLRNETKFQSVDALLNQIRADIEQANKLFGLEIKS